jgi:hypothetical protein
MITIFSEGFSALAHIPPQWSTPGTLGRDAGESHEKPLRVATEARRRFVG